MPSTLSQRSVYAAIRHHLPRSEQTERQQLRRDCSSNGDLQGSKSSIAPASLENMALKDLGKQTKQARVLLPRLQGPDHTACSCTCREDRSQHVVPGAVSSPWMRIPSPQVSSIPAPCLTLHCSLPTSSLPDVSFWDASRHASVLAPSCHLTWANWHKEIIKWTG